MSKSFTRTLNEAERTQRQQDLISFLTQGGSWKPWTEEFESDMTFSRSDALRDSALESVEGAPANRMAAIWACAVARDAKYTHAGPIFLRKQAHHNALRETYEGGKKGVDNELAYSDEP